MEEEDREVQLDDTAEGPGKEYELYLKNEELLDKLKLLNYEDGFLAQGFRPIQRHYFVKQTNVGEQFYQFTSLAAWLIQKAGNESFQMPQEFDDPNSTTARIISELRAKNVEKLKNAILGPKMSLLRAAKSLGKSFYWYRWASLVFTMFAQL